jgi:hypothetical protein
MKLIYYRLQQLKIGKPSLYIEIVTFDEFIQRIRDDINEYGPNSPFILEFKKGNKNIITFR